MKHFLPLIFFLTPLIAFSQWHQADTVLLLMGSRYELSAVHEDSVLAQQSIEAGIKEIQRIENLISSWKEGSQTSLVNKNAGVQAITVDEELFSLIQRSFKISNLTDGYFNIAFEPLAELWSKKGKTGQLPTTEEIDSARQLVDIKNVLIDKENSTVFLKLKGMKIGFGAIGKGYSANMAKKVMLDLGIKNGMVNAGGDLSIWGNNLENQPWKIGIADPDKKESFVAWLDLTNASIVTSGNYEKFIEIKGKRYTHIVNPTTGFPVEGVKSVTIISPDAELSDALATSVFVMGVEKGLELINRLKNIECLIIDDQNKYWQSKGLRLNFY